ncbi:LPS export ABC transporter periplasmic protein LptC [Oleiagrimonas sp. C23AA]|uniref:LPS export ABC transporter periplasmic protein LptC n=1 Tax=Oleiagrimonas sp. C23AA TaxID=2719047 RepID=UPI001422F0CA|nr:LPS export ABC transporter periplasmic protein LptC [Oleiagrimonas sp. C23AA]NII11523.1 LPS export ABC transporter periplasmic protein LptC [Oleiagrimonas sp. C23AA]
MAVMPRRMPGTIVLLALAALAVWAGVWWIQPAAKPDTFVGPPRSGYTLRDFTLWAYADDGTPSFRLKAPYLQRREGDDSLYLNAPHFYLPPAHNAPGEPWTGQSDYGWVSADGNVLKLQGKVHMHRKPFGSTPFGDIQTSDVTAWPKQNRVATDAHALMKQGAATLSGTGLRANLDSQHLELLHDVHGFYPPSKH